ncbi:MAG: hypothetical protein AAF657_09495 [Acidobacteriota bacterium]
MPWQEIHRQLLGGLLSELRSQWGRIREVEESLGIGTAGYLNKMCSGKAEIRLKLFLQTLSALGVEPRSFFSRALEICPRPEDYLAQIGGRQQEDKALDKMIEAAGEIEASEPPAAERLATADADDVALFVLTPRKAQQRALRHGKSYASHAFARAYLEYLDDHRYDHAVEAARMATGVVKDLLPRLPGPPNERLALLCFGLGVFGSARRSKGRFRSAARALRLALSVAERAGLQEDTANLLIRASYLLKDHGHVERALALLKEALVVFVRLGSRRDMGRVLVDQGMMSCYLGAYDTAVQDLEQGLACLADTTEALPRTHLAAYQFLAYASEQRGDLDAAEGYLAAGMRACGASHAVDRARLQWSLGTLALERGAVQQAEDWLRSALAVLAEHENALQEAVVILDLLRALLSQGKNREAIETAVSMSQLLGKFTNNTLAEATILGLVRAALDGELDEASICQVRDQLSAGKQPARGLPERG